MYTFPIPHNLWGALFRWVFLKLCLYHVSFLLLKLKVSLKLSLGLSAWNSRSSAGRETHSSVFLLQSKQQTSKLANKGCFGSNVFFTTALSVSFVARLLRKALTVCLQSSSSAPCRHRYSLTLLMIWELLCPWLPVQWPLR